MIRVGIIGGAGYTAGELLRILLNHPQAQIAFVQSSSNAGNPLWAVHSGLYGETDLHFCADADLSSADVVFLCSGHGKSSAFWAEHPRPAGLKVVDLAQDYRDEHDGYVYGLPEWQKDKIAGADLVANQVGVTAITGSTGAGVKPGATTHFSWRNNNLSVYKAFTHQHLLEIHRTLNLLQPGLGEAVRFVPVRGDFARGILAAVTVPCRLSTEEATALYQDYYQDAAFTFVFPGAVDLKQVVNTNKCLLSLEAQDGTLLVTSVIDNLLKGASGQAVQNMNLMFGLPEKTGLQLKASAF